MLVGVPKASELSLTLGAAAPELNWESWSFGRAIFRGPEIEKLHSEFFFSSFFVSSLESIL